MRRLALGLVLAACTPATPPPTPAKAGAIVPECADPRGCDDCRERCGEVPPRDLVGCDAQAGLDLWSACCARVREETERLAELCAGAKACSLAPHVSPYSPDLMSACAE